MSQKINPISNRLGTLQIWNSNFQKYGGTFKCYKRILPPQKYIFVYLNRFLLNQDLLVENVNIFYFKHYILVKVFIFSPKVNAYVKNKSISSHIFSNWLHYPVKLEFYTRKHLSNSSFLIINYIQYLFVQKFYTSKRILQLLSTTLKTPAFKSKVVQTSFGIKKVKLKGFKLEFTGCFEASRSQMSKTLKCNFGSNPLTKINMYVDYSSDVLFTRFGTCGLKLWLFYELL